MKKIIPFTFMAIAMIAAFASCIKSPVNDQYVGDSKVFVYSPSLIAPVSYAVNPTNNVATVVLNNGGVITLDCLTPNTPGDAFITECPIIPQSWRWNQSNYQYSPEGFSYNAKYGFGSDFATVWFVEKNVYGVYTLKNKAVSWTSTPNPASWVNSFRGLSGISSIVMPKKGLIGYGVNPGQIFFSLP